MLAKSKAKVLLIGSVITSALVSGVTYSHQLIARKVEENKAQKTAVVAKKDNAKDVAKSHYSQKQQNASEVLFIGCNGFF